MKRTLVTIAALLLIAAGAHAAISYSVSGSPTQNVPGWTTWVLTFSADMGMYPTAFDLQIGDGVTTLRQTGPVFGGAPTYPALGYDDTHFPFVATTEVVVGPGAGESGTYLQAPFALVGGCLNPLAGPSIAVAHVVLQNGASVPFTGTVVESDPATNTVGSLYPTSGIIPEPATIALLGIGAAVLLRRKR